MQSFPLFLSLRDRRALVVGGIDHAASKIELLMSAGARVSLVAETVTGCIAQLIADRHIAWVAHRFEPEALDGMSIVIVAGVDPGLQGRVSRAAQARGVPVNVVDNAALSSFTMPAIIDRGPVTIAISTGGAAPALARKLRAEIERALPQAIGRLARFAELFRAQVRRTLAEPRARRLFWDRVFEGRVGELALAGDEIAARRALICLLDSARGEPAATEGVVHLVGAGPGDPDLLTLKAHRLLQHADIVVYDRLVSSAVLAAARRDAERVLLPQAKIAPHLVALARGGRSVVRLSGASLFPEIEVLRAAGVSIEVVPGASLVRPSAYSVKISV